MRTAVCCAAAAVSLPGESFPPGAGCLHNSPKGCASDRASHASSAGGLDGKPRMSVACPWRVGMWAAGFARPDIPISQAQNCVNGVWRDESFVIAIGSPAKADSRGGRAGLRWAARIPALMCLRQDDRTGAPPSRPSGLAATGQSTASKTATGRRRS